MKQRLTRIKNLLEEKKAQAIESIVLPHQGYIVDAVVLATTLNEKHTLSLITYLKEDLKPQQEEFVRIDEDENWTVIDLGDILIHLMTSSYREKYQLDNFLAELS